MLKFSQANAKTQRLYNVPQLRKWLEDGRKVYSFDLLAGHTCPSAKDCRSSVIETKSGNLKIKDGEYTQFRCYAASSAVLWKNVYRLQKHNTKRVLSIAQKKGADGVKEELAKWCPKNAGIIRIHSSGDMATKAYFQGWLKFIESRPDVLFYTYTKQLKFWAQHKEWINRLSNLSLVASYGGWSDKLIEQHKLRFAKVVYSAYEARKLGLKIDKSDEIACRPDLRKKNFALLLHGQQPPGKAAKAWARIKKTAGGYSK